MPRFFFHVREESFVPDPDGIEFPDPAAARAAAVEGVRGMICDQVRQGRLCLGYGMESSMRPERRFSSLRSRMPYGAA